MKKVIILACACIALVGLSACGGNRAANVGQSPEIAVNSFLWQASLDTVRFLPLASADPFGGVIITDWYVSEQYPDERFKLTVYLLDSQLRADALSVNVAREVRQPDGWVAAEAHPTTAVSLENLILTRARELKIATLDS